MDHFLKNAQKRAILGHFVPLQNFTESNISLSGHVPPLPKPQTKIFLNHCDAIRTSKEEIFCCPPPCRETTTPDRCVVETEKGQKIWPNGGQKYKIVNFEANDAYKLL